MTNADTPRHNGVHDSTASGGNESAAPAATTPPNGASTPHSWGCVTSHATSIAPSADDPLTRFLEQRTPDSSAARPQLAFDATVMPVDEFLGKNYEVPYLIEDVLPGGQICIVGGPEKGQKSNLLVDAAIALASGKRWLGHFAVLRPYKVLYLTGETQGANLQNIINRVLAARGLTVADLGARLLIKEALPAFDDDKQLGVFRCLIAQQHVEVVILDPLYFALGQIDSHVLTLVGPTIAKVGKMCIEAGATPVFAHHMGKAAQMRRAEEREPMQLADLNGAGFGPVAGSWILVSYLAPYDPDEGNCAIWLSVGGRSGHGGIYAVEIHEGKFEKHMPLHGRRWRTEVWRGQEAKDLASVIKGVERRQKKQADARANAAADEKLMSEIREWMQTKEPTGAIQSDIEARFALAVKKCRSIVTALFERLWIARAERRAGDNPNAHRWRIVPEGLSEMQLALLRDSAPLEGVIGKAQTQ